MRAWARRAVFVGIATSAAACGYPEFGFVPEVDSGALDDVGIDSTIADTTVADTSVDTTVADTGATDSAIDATIDSSVDSATDTKLDSTVADTRDAAADSGVDAPKDTFVAPDTSADVYDTSPTCALIDDLEDGDGAIIAKCGRHGFWFTFNDGTATGTQQPPIAGPFTASSIPGGRAGSTFAARTNGSGFTAYGAGMGVQFNGGSTPYDAHGWSGVGFWARVATGTVTTIRMDFPDNFTDPHGGTCGTECYDHFGTYLTFSTTWTYYVVKWSDLTQEGWGLAAPSGKIDAYHVYNMQIQTGGSSVFDVWIDDMTFVP